MMLVKLNAPFDDQDKMVAVLRELQKVQSEKMDPERSFSVSHDPDGVPRPQFVVGDLHLNILVGFGLRFFLGPRNSRQRQNEQPVQNFPPGGLFTPRPAIRFGMKDRGLFAPLYLMIAANCGDVQTTGFVVVLFNTVAPREYQTVRNGDFSFIVLS
jgi:hypothetical protein